MFLREETEFCNFANDTAIYSCSLNHKEAHRKLPIDSLLFQTGFELIAWLLILVKCQISFLGSSINDSNITFIVENKPIKSTNEVKLLGIAIDHKLTFTKHISYAIPQVTV